MTIAPLYPPPYTLRILEANPAENSNFRSMILQDMLSTHLKGLSDLLLSNIKFTLKMSIPLAISVLSIVLVNGYEMITTTQIMV